MNFVTPTTFGDPSCAGRRLTRSPGSKRCPSRSATPTTRHYDRPPYTQALDLYDTARRLGTDVPEWAKPSAFDDHDFNPPAKEELPEGVYETEGFWISPVRF